MVIDAHTQLTGRSLNSEFVHVWHDFDARKTEREGHTDAREIPSSTVLKLDAEQGHKRERERAKSKQNTGARPAFRESARKLRGIRKRRVERIFLRTSVSYIYVDICSTCDFPRALLIFRYLPNKPTGLLFPLVTIERSGERIISLIGDSIDIISLSITLLRIDRRIIKFIPFFLFPPLIVINRQRHFSNNNSRDIIPFHVQGYIGMLLD